MTHVPVPMTNPRSSWPAILSAYLVMGVGVGIVPLQQVAAGAGLRAGVGTALGVNLVLPLLALCLAIWRPRLWTVWAGGLLLALGFFLGALLRIEPRVWMWTGTLLLQASHPILLVAAIGYGVVGTVGVLARGGLRHRPRAGNPV